MITIRNLVKSSHANYKNIKSACQKTSTVFNCANYITRQDFFNGDIRSCSSIDKELKFKNNIYNSIPNAASQAIIKKMGVDWKSFFKALKEWKKNPLKFKKRQSLCSIREYDFDLETLNVLYQNIEASGLKIYRFHEHKSNINYINFEKFNSLPREINKIQKHNFGVILLDDIKALDRKKKMSIIKSFSKNDIKLQNKLVLLFTSFQMRGDFLFNEKTRKELCCYLEKYSK